MHHVQPNKNANVTVTSKKNRKVQAKFHHGVSGRWTLAFGIAEVELMSSLDNVELSFISGEQTYSAKARITGVNSAIGSCIVDNIHEYNSRPLRGDDRIDVQLPCSVIARDDRGSSNFIDRQRNQITNLSCSGALLSTSIAHKNGSSLLLLFSLDVHLDLEPSSHRMYMRGTIVREQENMDSSFSYHYGFHFVNTNPSSEHLLKVFLEYEKLNASID